MGVHRTIAQVLAATAASKGVWRFAVLGALALAGLLAPAAHAQGATPLTGATGIAAGDRHACALLATGEVACWDRNYCGQLGRLQPGPDTVGTAADRASAALRSIVDPVGFQSDGVRSIEGKGVGPKPDPLRPSRAHGDFVGPASAGRDASRPAS